MKKFPLCVGILMLLGLALSAQPPGPVAKIYLIKVKPGMAAQFREAYKAHVDWHREQNDSWAWDAWVFESGERVGQYVVVTPGHKWSDFDTRGEMGRADEEDAERTLLPLVESIEVSWSQALPDLSRMPQTMTDLAVARVTDYYVRPGKGPQFATVIRKVKEALAGTDRNGALLWTQSLTGPAVYSAIEMLPDWASLAPPEKSMMEVIAAKLGPMETARLVETFADCVEHTDTQIVRYLKDLSYAPSPTQ